MGIPVIVSAWFPPEWAVIESAREAFRPRSDGLRGVALDPDKMETICSSIAAYLFHLKNAYGVDAHSFSFNESDLGINVRQTGEEHAKLIKTLGRRLQSRGLATRLLLGDTSDARPIEFIRPALDDPETHPFIAAVSFHSWRGCTNERLQQWSAAAQQLNVPLIVGEGSTDAAAWRYNEIFSESTFAFYEIDLYTRILAIAQPLSILQWQLTSDYSLLVGGGVFGTDGPLRPTQRFWNLKQLASTPAGAFHLPVVCEGANLNCAAMGNVARGEYVVHIVNNGTRREASIDGIPTGVDELRVIVTDHERGMVEVARVPVKDGAAEVVLEAASFVSLLMPASVDLEQDGPGDL
jgi:hypothetical protein